MEEREAHHSIRITQLYQLTPQDRNPGLLFIRLRNRRIGEIIFSLRLSVATLPAGSGSTSRVFSSFSDIPATYSPPGRYMRQCLSLASNSIDSSDFFMHHQFKE